MSVYANPLHKVLVMLVAPELTMTKIVDNAAVIRELLEAPTILEHWHEGSRNTCLNMFKDIEGDFGDGRQIVDRVIEVRKCLPRPVPYKAVLVKEACPKTSLTVEPQGQWLVKRMDVRKGGQIVDLNPEEVKWIIPRLQAWIEHVEGKSA